MSLAFRRLKVGSGSRLDAGEVFLVQMDGLGRVFSG